jgi:hypothetical protein
MSIEVEFPHINPGIAREDSDTRPETGREGGRAKRRPRRVANTTHQHQTTSMKLGLLRGPCGGAASLCPLPDLSLVECQGCISIPISRVPLKYV